MPLYHYRCPNCRDNFIRHVGMDRATELVACPNCLGSRGPTIWLNRVYDFNYHADLPEHFSHTTGTPVRGHRHFRDELKRLSDEASERTGIHHNFVPTDYTQPANLGVTEEGLEHTFRTKRNNGIGTGEEAMKWL